ncbi:FtsK/SpoIIIE domain-containing protein [Isoptericola sp. NPDC055881]
MSTSTVPALVVTPDPGDDGVRVTVHPGEDVLLPAGAPLGTCRADLAGLLRRPELRHTPLAADGVPVDDADVVGARPLLPGAVLTPHDAAATPSRPDRSAAVLDGPWFVARADGAAAGATLTLSPGAPRSLHDARSTARHDAATSPPGVVVRVDPRRPDRVTVRSVGRRQRPARSLRVPSPGLLFAGPPRLVSAGPPGGPRAGARRRRVGRLPRRWRPGARLELPGGAVPAAWTLHRSGSVAAWLDGRGGGEGRTTARPSAQSTQPSSPGSVAMLATAAVPVLGSVVLAIVLRQPAYALFSLLGLGTLVPQVVAARRRRRAADPTVAADGGQGNVVERAAVGDSPGPLLARLAAAHQASDGAWRAAVARAHERSRATDHPGAGVAVGPGSSRAARAVARLVPDGALALVGPRHEVLAAARSVVVELAAWGASVEVAGAAAWSWCRWLPGGGPPLVVVDPGDGAASADTARREDALARGGAVLLCLPEGAPVPAWCRTVWRVRGGRVRRAAPDGSTTTGPLVGVDEAWAERAARLVAGVAGLHRSLGALESGTGGATASDLEGPADPAGPADPRFPATVPLLPLLDELPDVGAAWDRADGWAVPLGRDARGRPVLFDLVTDGPHLLVAGTTGSGKSELLQALLLGLACRRSPDDLALALVDFKGGASFGACGRLPHVVGQVTDLDPGLAGRALAGLRAELHRRKQVLARHGVADVDALPAGVADAPARLVVVVDEFRALADDLPEFLPGLLRVAAQGRSLGVHLVLATQRPAGAVSADLRANVSARLALRVVDPADSLDVVDTPLAARIPPGTPGRGVLRCGAAPPVVLQCAHAAGRAATPAAVRRAPAWGAACGTEASRTGAAGPGVAGPGVAGPGAAEVVEAVREAAAVRGQRAGRAPWLPPLPESVRSGDPVLAAAAPGAGDDAGPGPVGDVGVPGLPVALGDDPEHQRRTLLRWDPAAGHLGVVGRARSGRTTALVGLAAGALARGWHVHALAPAAALPRFAALDEHAGFGTLAGPGSPRRTARLLRLLGTAPPTAPTLVVVDAVEELRAALTGPDPGDPLARALATPGVAFALSSDGPMLGGLAARVGPRLVLLGREAHADVLLGAPSELAGRGGPPGRAAWLGQDQLLCQVLLPGHGPPSPARPPGRSGAAPVTVRELPPSVDERDLARAARPHPPDASVGTEGGLVVPLGVGGDEAEVVGLDVTHGLLVTGPRGSGRTTVLRRVVRHLAAAGLLAGVVARDAALRRDAGRVPAAPPSSADLRSFLDELRPGVLVVDDLDALVQQHPLEADRIAAMVDAAGRALVAASTTTGTALAHRGALAELRARRTAVVLHPGERGADELFGVPLADAVEPGPAQPGRGALVQGCRVLAVQVARSDDAEQPSTPRPELRWDGSRGDGSRGDGSRGDGSRGDGSRGDGVHSPSPPGDGSAGGGLDHAARHDGHEHGGGDQQEPEPCEHRRRHPGREQADADQALHDLPHDDGRAPGAPACPQGAARADEQPAEAQAEQHEEHAHGYAVGGTPHQLDADHGGRGDEQHHLEPDPGRDHAQARRTGPSGSTVGAGRGGDRSAHDTSEYVRPAVSRQCDQALTLHARETSP